MRWLWALCAAATLGCDDQYALENVDVFTCAVLPSWMADCQDQAVHDKAVSVLEHGLVQSRISCSGLQSFDVGVCALDDTLRNYSAVRFADGSALTDAFYSAREAQSEYLSAAQAGGLRGTFSVFGDGNVTMHKPGCTSVVFDIETYCTGYNLEALGVE